MKTKHKSILVIAILLLGGMTINKSYADKPPAEKAFSTKDMQSLAPTAPPEADFNDADINQTFDIISLAPSVPGEADFNDMPAEVASALNLAPIIPAVADFEDASDEITVDFDSLAPVTPAETDFE